MTTHHPVEIYDENGAHVPMSFHTHAPLHIRYLKHVPTGPPPAGQAVVHNHVVPAEELGDRGFRSWQQDYDPSTLTLCHCPWAPALDQHYRVTARTDVP